MKIIVNPPHGQPLDAETGTQVIMACQKVVEGLGLLAQAIESIEFTFGHFPGTTINDLQVRVELETPIGEPCWHGTDSRFFRKDADLATAISEHLLEENCLPKFIPQHLRRMQRELGKEIEWIGSILASTEAVEA